MDRLRSVDISFTVWKKKTKKGCQLEHVYLLKIKCIVLRNKVGYKNQFEKSLSLWWVYKSQLYILTPLGLHLLRYVLWTLWCLPLLSLQCVDLGENLYYMAVQNLVYRYRNVYLIIVANFDAASTRHIQHIQQFSKIIIQTVEGPQSKLLQIPNKRPHVRLHGLNTYTLDAFATQNFITD